MAARHLPAPTDQPITARSPITYQDPLPDEVDVVVIGAGVIGICSALYMARDGLSVLVVEKGRVAAEQSSRNWGWVRQHNRDRAELPIMMHANRLWQELDRETAGATGFRQTGICYIASSEAEMQAQARFLDVAREHGLDSHALGPSELHQRIGHAQSGVGRRWMGGFVTPSDARAEPWRAVPAFARLAHRDGVAIRENCAVRSLIVQGEQITGVQTEHGAVRCARVVLAAGAWSSLFLQQHGRAMALPQLSVRSTVAQTAPMPAVFEGNFSDEVLAVRRRADGGYTLAHRHDEDHYIGPDSFRHLRRFLPVLREARKGLRLHVWHPAPVPDPWLGRTGATRIFERVRVLDPRPNAATVERMRAAFAARFPSLGSPVIQHAWAGMIDTTPDILPIIDHHPGFKGLTLATGMCGHGFGIGPGVGKVVAALVADRPTGHDTTGLRYGRF